MKKGLIIKLIIAILSLVSLACVAFGCGGGGSLHEHKYDQKVASSKYLESDATCEKKARYYYSCKCGDMTGITFEYGNVLEHNYGICYSNKNGTHTKICSNDSRHILTEYCSGGTATCGTRAVCKDCGEEYGKFGQHKGGKATCTELAECSLCGEKYGSYNHNYDSSPEYSYSEHWYECIDCGYEGLREDHMGGTATCTELANCSVCGVKYGQYNHKYDKLMHDDERHWYECDCGSINYSGSHEGGLSTCASPAKCTVCGFLYGDYANHKYINGKCKYCMASECVNYTLLSSENEYEVTGVNSSDYTNIVIASMYNGKPVTSIGNDAFWNCRSLRSIVIPDSVTSIGNYAFWDCSSLTSIVIPNSVTSIGNDAFRNCSSLVSIEIPNSVTSIGYGAFEDCSSLRSIEIPNSVTSIGNGTFYYCSSLTSITIPNSVTSIGFMAFFACSSLTSVVIPNSVTSIGGDAFSGCSSLISIEIPNSVTEIGSYTFDHCSSLTSVTIPNSVTSIGDSAFSYCASLTSITIPNSVTSIGDSAFSYCASLTSIKFNGTKAKWNAIEKGYYWNENVPATKVVCTDGNVSIS